MATPANPGSSACSSPEFEFRVPGTATSTDDRHLLTADELFADGVLIPLAFLPLQPPQLTADPTVSAAAEAYFEPTNPCVAAAVVAFSSVASSPKPISKRWTDIFKAGEKKAVAAAVAVTVADEKGRRRGERKPAASGATELNINFWPFGRSRSAGNAAAKPPNAAAPSRKVSSAPCSRSNSRGDGQSRSLARAGSSAPATRRWAASPGRSGVPVGRASPVWQIRRTGVSSKGEPARKNRAAATVAASSGRRSNSGLVPRGINLSVNSCIGYRHQGSCRRADGDGLGLAGGDPAGGAAGVVATGAGSIFGLRALLFRKVH